MQNCIIDHFNDFSCDNYIFLVNLLFSGWNVLIPLAKSHIPHLGNKISLLLTVVENIGNNTYKSRNSTYGAVHITQYWVWDLEMQ